MATRKGKVEKVALSERPCQNCGLLMVPWRRDQNFCSSCHGDGNTSTHNYIIKRRYGICRAEWNEILQQQNGGCAVCGKARCSRGRLHVDHCHKTGKVRGLLCENCNAGIGRFQDSSSLLRRAAEYLEKSDEEE